MTSPAPSFAAIVSAGRDGSTLLQRLLDGAPGLWMHPLELKFGNRLSSVGHVVRGSALNRILLDQLDDFDREYAPHLGRRLEADRSGSSFDADRSYGFAEAVTTYVEAAERAFCRGADAAVRAFKTTEIEYEDLYGRVPGLRTIHVVRDPVRQFASTKRTVLRRSGFLFHYGAGDLLTTFAKRYVRHARSTLAGVADASRHLLVRYEELVSSPTAEVERVARWLGVEPPPRPDELTVLGQPASELPANPSEPGVATPTRVVADMADEYGYGSVTTERERRLLVLLTGSCAARLGYPYPESEFPFRERARLVREWLPVEPWERELMSRPTGRRSFARRRLLVLRSAICGATPA